MPNSHLAYCRDIDGLRAIAILAVIAFHAFPAAVRGGFVGVDVFFVISGYLISCILLKNLDRGDFSINEFYARRIRRIFPALTIVLFSCLALGWFVLMSDEYKMLAKHSAAGAFFFANFAFWHETGYFDPAAELKPLLHLWSLGIEEQFYIFWPPLLMLAYRFKFNTLIVMLTLAVTSFALNIVFIEGHPTATFYLPHTRAWELLIGNVLAYIHIEHGELTRQRLGNRARDVLSISGLALILAAAFVTRKSNLFPGWWALLPTFGAFLLILAGPNAVINRRILSSKIMVVIGLISYPLYLWHWPLLSFASILTNGAMTPGVRAGAVALAFLLAWLTYFLVERKIKSSRLRAMPTRLAGALFVVACAGAAIFVGNGIPDRHEDAERIAAAAGEWEHPGKFIPHAIGEETYYSAGGNGSQTLYYGDSNMEQYGPRIYDLVKDNKGSERGAIFLTHGGCPPLPGVREPSHPYCDGLTQKFLKLSGDSQVDTVVIAAAWYNYFHSSTYYIGAAQLLISSDAGQLEAMANLQQLITNLVAANKRVYLVLNIPLWGNFDPKNMIHRNLRGGFKVDTAPVQQSTFMSIFGPINDRLIKVAKLSGAQIIDPLDTLCTAGVCPIVDGNGDPLYRDTMHIRPKFVKSQVRYLDKTVAF